MPDAVTEQQNDPTATIGQAAVHQPPASADAPNDPSHVEAQPAPAAPPAAPDAPPAPEVSLAPQTTTREQLAERFNQRRREENAARGKPDYVPFIERQEEDAAVAPQAPNAAAPAPESVAPAPVTPPQLFKIKVLGKDMELSRADAIRYASEIEPHDTDKLSDRELHRLAQMGAAGLAFVNEGKSFRDQARVAAPPSAGNPAGNQQQPSPQPPQAPSLPELLTKATEATQLGDASEAAKAWEAYYDARDTDRQARQDAQSFDQQSRATAQRDVAEFGDRNQDIVGNPMLGDMLLMTATREMESDLRTLGLTDEHLHAALNNPAIMTEIYGQARKAGLQVRSNKDLLEAAGTKVRQFANLPVPAAAPAQAPMPTAVQTRIDEKRGLQAQPTRSGNPQPVTPPKPDPSKTRSAAIEQMQRSRGKGIPAAMSA